MSLLYGWLFKRVLRLDMTGTGPPWPLTVHNPDTGLYESIGGSSGVTSLLQLPGDPPDFVTVNGETITVEGR